MGVGVMSGRAKGTGSTLRNGGGCNVRKSEGHWQYPQEWGCMGVRLNVEQITAAVDYLADILSFC